MFNYQVLCIILQFLKKITIIRQYKRILNIKRGQNEKIWEFITKWTIYTYVKLRLSNRSWTVQKNLLWLWNLSTSGNVCIVGMSDLPQISFTGNPVKKLYLPVCRITGKLNIENKTGKNRKNTFLKKPHS